MTNKDLNNLYEKYLADAGANETALFTAITDRARKALQDDDEAQDFVIRVWKELPIPGRDKGSFGYWLHRRLLWHRLDAKRRLQASRETAVSRISVRDPEYGHELSNEEKLDLFRFRADAKEGKDQATVTITTINDPIIRQASEMLLLGYTQKEIADRLGIGFEALRKRLQRFSG